MATVETSSVYEAVAQEPVQVIAVMEAKTDNPDVEFKIRKAFPENWEVMLAIAQAESELNPQADNPEQHKGCVGSIGLFQIACIHVDDKEQLKDVDYNIEVARQIYNTSGLEPWGAYTDGRYLKYL